MLTIKILHILLRNFTRLLIRMLNDITGKTISLFIKAYDDTCS